MRRLILPLALAAAAALPAAAQETKQPFWMGKRMPMLTAPKEHWVNLEKGPTTRELEGKLLWVQFTFLG